VTESPAEDASTGQGDMRTTDRALEEAAGEDGENPVRVEKEADKT